MNHHGAPARAFGVRTFGKTERTARRTRDRHPLAIEHRGLIEQTRIQFSHKIFRSQFGIQRGNKPLAWKAAEAVRIIAILLAPAIPDGAQAILHQLGIDRELSEWNLTQATWGGLEAGTSIGEIEAVYPRLDIADFRKDSKEAEPQEEAAQPESAAPEKSSDRISIEDFARVEMRVARIIHAERGAKSSKLLKLRVDLGTEQRQVVAGIGKAYDPENLIGKKVVVVTNLQPAKLMGVESNGMIVAASEKGRPVLATFDEDVALGTRLK